MPFPAASHLPPDDTPSLHTTLPCSPLESNLVLTLTQYKPETWRRGRNKGHSTGQQARARARGVREAKAASDQDSTISPLGLEDK